MNLVALDTVKLTALMVAGAGFALAGLWLMFRPQPAGEAARAEIFGLKFQASSAGLVVFLIGALFLALPVFVPEKAAPRAADGGGRPAGAGAAVAPILVPEGGPEVEPNDHPRGANLIEVGKVYSGEVRKGERDYFRADLDGTAPSLRFIWRVLASTGQPYEPLRCRLDVLDQHEVNTASETAPFAGQAKSGVLDVAGVPVSFFKVEGIEGSCTYELEARYEKL